MKTSTLRLRSPAFADGEPMPVRYAPPDAGGQNLSPPLEWGEPPAGTLSFALAVIDVDARGFAHWLVEGLAPQTRSLAEGASGTGMPEGARELYNTFGLRGWGGPKPPPGAGEHRYRFLLFALSVPRLSVHDGVTSTMFLDEAETHAVASAEMSAFFGR